MLEKAFYVNKLYPVIERYCAVYVNVLFIFVIICHVIGCEDRLETSLNCVVSVVNLCSNSSTVFIPKICLNLNWKLGGPLLLPPLPSA